MVSKTDWKVGDEVWAHARGIITEIDDAGFHSVMFPKGGFFKTADELQLPNYPMREHTQERLDLQNRDPLQAEVAVNALKEIVGELERISDTVASVLQEAKTELARARGLEARP